MYAIISFSGSQHKVQEGDELLLPRLDAKPKAKITVSDVLLLATDKKTYVGTPTVPQATVKLEILEHLKGKKIRVSTYKAKSRYRRTIGHRDHLTRVKILSILSRENKSSKKPKSK